MSDRPHGFYMARIAGVAAEGMQHPIRDVTIDAGTMPSLLISWHRTTRASGPADRGTVKIPMCSGKTFQAHSA